MLLTEGQGGAGPTSVVNQQCQFPPPPEPVGPMLNGMRLLALVEQLARTL